MFSSTEFSPVPVIFRRHSAQSPWTYEQLDALQQEIAERVGQGGSGALLISEVAPVITRGRRTREADLLLSSAELRVRGIEVVSAGRGGLATYHGPGQWVVFVVERLDRLTGDRRGVRRAVEGLLEVGAAVSRLYRTDVEIRWGAETGVWSSRGKLVSVGVQIEKGVLLHGLAINGYRTEQSFLGLRPCGLDAPVDFLWEDASHFEALPQQIEKAVLEQFWGAILRKELRA